MVESLDSRALRARPAALRGPARSPGRPGGEPGQHTGRAAKDKYVVEEDETRDNIWWGKVNVPYSEEKYDGLLERMRQHLRTKDVFVQDVWACADERYRLPVRVITRNAWQSIFIRNMFRRPPRTPEVIKNFVPTFTVLCCPDFHADPDLDDTRSGTFVALNLKRRLVLIGGTAYAGEMKKSIFTSLNYHAARQRRPADALLGQRQQ